MKVIHILITLLCPLLLSACLSTKADSIAPALLNLKPSNKQKLELALANILKKSDVKLKSDAFSKKNKVFLERPFLQDNKQQLIDGRRTEQPISVFLFKKNALCLLKINDTYYPVKNISCKKIPPQ